MAVSPSSKNAPVVGQFTSASARLRLRSCWACPMRARQRSNDTESVVSGLIEAIKDISTEEVNAGLASHGLACADSHEVNISNLARALVA